MRGGAIMNFCDTFNLSLPPGGKGNLQTGGRDIGREGYRRQSYWWNDQCVKMGGKGSHKKGSSVTPEVLTMTISSDGYGCTIAEGLDA